MEGKEEKGQTFSLVSLLHKGLFGWDLTTSRLSCANQRARISVMQIQYSQIIWYIYRGHWTPADMISKRKQIMQSEWNLWLIYSLTQIFKHLVKMQEAGKHPNKIFYSSLYQAGSIVGSNKVEIITHHLNSFILRRKQVQKCLHVSSSWSLFFTSDHLLRDRKYWSTPQV